MTGETKQRQKINNDIILANCHVIVIFLIYSQFETTRKPDSGHIVCKTYILTNRNLLSYKN